MIALKTVENMANYVDRLINRCYLNMFIICGFKRM